MILTEGMQSVLIEDPPRSISLVPGHTYTIECEGEWFQDGSPVTDDTSDPVHVTIDGAPHELHLQPFGMQLEGEYVCESGGDTAALNITAGTCHNAIYTGHTTSCTVCIVCVNIRVYNYHVCPALCVVLFVCPLSYVHSLPLSSSSSSSSSSSPHSSWPI